MQLRVSHRALARLGVAICSLRRGCTQSFSGPYEGITEAEASKTPQRTVIVGSSRTRRADLGFSITLRVVRRRANIRRATLAAEITSAASTSISTGTLFRSSRITTIALPCTVTQDAIRPARC